METNHKVVHDLEIVLHVGRPTALIPGRAELTAVALPVHIRIKHPPNISIHRLCIGDQQSRLISHGLDYY